MHWFVVGPSSQHNAGLGLFADRSFTKGQLLANLYAHGKSPLVCQFQSLIHCRMRGFLDLSDNITGAQFANSGKIHNNAKFTECACVVAKSNIRKGDEVLCGYGSAYWKRVSMT